MKIWTRAGVSNHLRATRDRRYWCVRVCMCVCVISYYLYLAKCSPKGHGNGGGLLHDFPQPPARLASSAVTCGLPCRHSGAPISPSHYNKRKEAKEKTKAKNSPYALLSGSLLLHHPLLHFHPVSLAAGGRDLRRWIVGWGGRRCDLHPSWW